ncbi:hypothetical protein ANANG_G00073580 [Anguilla anguilla]|uniref:Uncharacterized protein n=1 Tax=Anguilla anguilla TaxID=7936 RepID=A0A9D3MR51_ANGAN|nr:hypothetical protein ANANG_G00073580 [Anguilla anguilla]
MCELHEPDRVPTISTHPPVTCKGSSKQRQSACRRAGGAAGRPDADALPPLHPYQPLECIVEETEGKLNELGQRISAIEKAQLQSLELIQGEPLTKDKIEELKKSREEQVQKKKRILKELQKVERQLQLKTQQQFTKEYMEAKGLKDDPGQTGVAQPPGPPAPTRRTPPCSAPTRTKRLAAPSFMPMQPLALQQSTDFSSADCPCTASPDLQRALVSQQMLGPGLLAQAPDGLMVATPAQTLTDTLDDIMAAVSSRVPMLSTTTPPPSLPLSPPAAAWPRPPCCRSTLLWTSTHIRRVTMTPL